MEKIYRNFNILLIILLSTLFLFKSPYVVKACDTKVKSEKAWTIKLNMKVDSSTLKDNVIVTDDKCNVIPVQASLWKLDEKFIIINPPKEQYDSGKIYYIILNKGLKSIYGDNLKERMVYKFYVEDQEADLLYEKIEKGLQHHVNKIYIKPEEQEKALKIAKKVIEKDNEKNGVKDIGIGGNLNEKTTWISFQYDKNVFWGYCEEDEFVTINLNNSTMPLGEFNFLDVKPNNANAKITYDVKDSNVVSIDSEGNIKALNTGKTYICVDYSYKGVFRNYIIPIEVTKN